MLSIIIPVYNREKLLPETLDSILSQSLCDWECILVDDHSTDGSQMVAQEYAQVDARFRFFIRPDDTLKGAGSCRNEGLKHAQGKYVFFMDSDDLIAPQFCETFIKYFEENPTLDYLNIRFARFQTDVAHSYRTSRVKPRGLTLAEAVAARKVSFATHSFIWRHDFLQTQKEFWIPDIHVYEDFEFSFRMILQSPNGLHVPLPICYFYRKHSSELRSVLPDKTARRERLVNTVTVLKKMVETCIIMNADKKIQRFLSTLMIKKMLLALKSKAPDVFDQLHVLAGKLHSTGYIKSKVFVLNVLRRFLFSKTL